MIVTEVSYKIRQLYQMMMSKADRREVFELELMTPIGRIFGISHIGFSRMSNEDRYWVNKLADGSVFLAVADGLGLTPTGGHAADIILSKLSKLTRLPEGSDTSRLKQLAVEMDRAVFQESENNPRLNGMGSTLVMVWLYGASACWVHVGDSRLYCLREGHLQQVTEDQTLSRFLLEENEISKVQSLTHYSRFVMDQYVGCGYAEPETGDLTLRNKDLLILTTDGLHNSVPEHELYRILTSAGDLKAKGEALVKTALSSGGSDNITLVLLERRATCK